MKPADHLSDERLAIYLFHGVIEANPYRLRNYTQKHLPKDTFARVIGELAHAGTPVSLDQVVAAHEGGEALPPRAFAVTFDDGFENNLTVAAPVLADHDVPATFYVTTSFVEDNAMSWTDRLEALFEAAPAGEVRLAWRDAPLAFEDVESRRLLLEELRQRIKTSPGLDVELLLADLHHQCGMPPSATGDGPLDQKLSWDQVRELASHRGFTIGGHSHTHAVLAFLGADELAHELDMSLDLLSRRAGVGPRHYSYPEGLGHCYSREVQEALRARGVVCCPTAIEGTNPPGQDLLELRRINVLG